MEPGSIRIFREAERDRHIVPGVCGRHHFRGEIEEALRPSSRQITADAYLATICKINNEP